MSDKEAQRPGIVRAARSGKVTNAEGALALGISVRQFRRLKVADKRLGVEGLIHGNRGRPSARRLKEADRNRIVELINGRYAGLNDCHLTEKLRELEKLEISRETVRQIRLAEHIAPVRRRRAPPHRSRRLRQAREGAMVLIDASQHLWLEERGPLWNLLGALDDATGKILVLHFRQHEDLHGYTKLLRRLTTHGLPCALYGDRLSVFVRNDDHWSLEEQLAGEQTPTQFGLMLAELAIGYITAHSPQAKGRIERLWETLQDRLVAELRLRGIDTIEEAEAYLPEFIRDYNQRFGAAVLLTSHYMDDVTALCPRVIVIDRGHLVYDGDLQELVRRVRPDKRVSIRLSAPADRALLDKLGTVVSADAAQVVLSVPAAKVNVVVRDALAALPVVDLTIEDPPLEEVMRELFSAQRGEAGGHKQAGA